MPGMASKYLTCSLAFRVCDRCESLRNEWTSVSNLSYWDVFNLFQNSKRARVHAYILRRTMHEFRSKVVSLLLLSVLFTIIWSKLIFKLVMSNSLVSRRYFSLCPSSCDFGWPQQRQGNDSRSHRYRSECGWHQQFPYYTPCLIRWEYTSIKFNKVAHSVRSLLLRFVQSFWNIWQRNDEHYRFIR